MTEDTWGIPGPAFLVIFVVAAFVAVIVAAVYRRVLTGGSVDRDWVPNGEQLAYFNGGPLQAVLASLTGMRAVGAVASQSGRLVVTGSVPSGPTALTWAIYQAAQRGERARTVAADPPVREALDDIRSELLRHGWLLSPGQRAAIRLRSLLVLGVAAIGVLRIMAGVANDKPVGYLVVLTSLVGIIGLFLLRAPKTSRAATRELGELYRRYAYLHDRSNPSFATYGAPTAALAVGLFGVGALVALDPMLAGDVGAPLRASANYDSGTGSACSSGSSCGGGSGGGGCGG